MLDNFILFCANLLDHCRPVEIGDDDDDGDNDDDGDDDDDDNVYRYRELCTPVVAWNDDTQWGTTLTARSVLGEIYTQRQSQL